MVSELDIGGCASEEVESLRMMDIRQCANKDAGPRGGLGGPTSIEKETSTSEDATPRRGVDCKTPHRLERRTKHCL